MNYLSLLNESYAEILTHRYDGDDPMSRLAYIGDYIFEFTTYDDSMSELFATKALEVCHAISNNTTFDYIKGNENYKWFLIMLNMPCLSNRVDWGCSIRGCWWDHEPNTTRFNFEDMTGLYFDGDQLDKLELDLDQWVEFIEAMREFVK